MSLREYSKEEVKKYYKSRIDIDASNRLKTLFDSLKQKSNYINDLGLVNNKPNERIEFSFIFICPCGNKSFLHQSFKYKDALVMDLAIEKENILKLLRVHLIGEGFVPSF